MGRRPTTYTLPVRHSGRDVSPVSVYTGGRRRWQDRVFSLLLIGTVIALLAVGASALGVRLPRGTGSARVAPTTSGLSALGVQRRSALALGSPVSLGWVSKPAAERYRLQIAAVGTNRHPSSRPPFGPSSLTVVTRQASYIWRAPTTGQFDWHVQAYAQGGWGPYSAGRRFTVIVPAISLPIPLLPHNGSRLTRAARLCWSRAQGAAGYYLWISGRHPVATTGLCDTVSLAAGAYTWRVAAYVRLPGRYAGRYSVPARFSILSPPRVRHSAIVVQQPHQSAAPPATTPAHYAPARVQTVPLPASRTAPWISAPAEPAPTRAVPATQPAPARAAPAPNPTAPVVTRVSRATHPTAPACIPLYTC
jgi:hypothetical protein